MTALQNIGFHVVGNVWIVGAMNHNDDWFRYVMYAWGALHILAAILLTHGKE